VAPQMSLRGKATVVECQISDLSQEALDWLNSDSPGDLCWVKKNIRVWQEVVPAEDFTKYYTKLSLAGQLAKEAICYFYSQDRAAGLPLKLDKSVDGLFFASNSDAVYFKMKFL
jgi:hypothetical protein